ncbi:MAG TPA: class I tRNA ligase family protein, partial [Nitrospira sp.]|nr:class I tRNA ligase family protein [Nitrospira sp.]
IYTTIMAQLIEAYRKIRNTCRFLLSNLYDFDPVTHRVPYEKLPELDRWALLRLGELTTKVRQAYEDFEFHTIFHALNNFCSVDLSAVYLDILKDRLYTFRKEAHERRSSQTVLYDIVMAMAKLMAPVLSFTAEEIWRILAAQVAGGMETASVHLASFPEIDPAWPDAKLAERWERLLKYRTQVQGVLEESRRGKTIGSSLEAYVHIEANADNFRFLKPYEQDLSALFIVSNVMLTQSPEGGEPLRVTVSKSQAGKCERCWNYREAVGKDAVHPTLCDRCVEAIR